MSPEIKTKDLTKMYDTCIIDFKKEKVSKNVENRVQPGIKSETCNRVSERRKHDHWDCFKGRHRPSPVAKPEIGVF